ncbi:hypothetical protein IGI04_025640 [Brassica rapa subsp. trilocularis]|uniref:Uncharacterized protein n=1 Tax=Brassica rapa subsp. trilocularis TaxID=1813537 RepID=A0ABQ7KTN1_BRACM|nr:hypothetical protein IGI04_025640 [Brassica rapa subsp. trilocularis]
MRLMNETKLGCSLSAVNFVLLRWLPRLLEVVGGVPYLLHIVSVLSLVVPVFVSVGQRLCYVTSAHVSVFRGGIFIGQRLGVYQCDGLLDLFLCFLTALVSSGWWRMVDSGGQVFIHSIAFYGGDVSCRR